MPEREAVYGADVGHHSAEGVRQEGAADLAYRGVMPRALGDALSDESAGTTTVAPGSVESVEYEPEEDEAYATRREVDDALQEAFRRAGALRRHRAAIRITTLLILGLRRIRAEYSRRIEAWKTMWELSIDSANRRAGQQGLEGPALCIAPGEVGPEIVSARAHAAARCQELRRCIAAWAASASGTRQIRLLRWALPNHAGVVAVVRASTWPYQRAGPVQIRSACEELGIPVRDGEIVSWGQHWPSWDGARARLLRPFSCTNPTIRQPSA